MTLSDKDISEIADLLDCGMVCFYHRTTGEIESHPDPDGLYFDPEPWQDVINKVENDWANYAKFEKMNSNEGFQMMENFAHSLSDNYFRDKILDQLSGGKPFQKFKRLIDSSDFRQEWFDFKNNANIDFVKRQIEIK
jgi:hypothetical protein